MSIDHSVGSVRTKKNTFFSAYTLSASGTKTSDEWEIGSYSTMTIYVKNGDSTDLDVEIQVSIDGGDNYGTHTTINFGNDEEETHIIDLGVVDFVKVKLTNNDSTNDTLITVKGKVIT